MAYINISIKIVSLICLNILILLAGVAFTAHAQQIIETTVRPGDTGSLSNNNTAFTNDRTGQTILISSSREESERNLADATGGSSISSLPVYDSSGNQTGWISIDQGTVNTQTSSRSPSCLTNPNLILPLIESSLGTFVTSNARNLKMTDATTGRLVGLENLQVGRYYIPSVSVSNTTCRPTDHPNQFSNRNPYGSNGRFPVRVTIRSGSQNVYQNVVNNVGPLGADYYIARRYSSTNSLTRHSYFATTFHQTVFFADSGSYTAISQVDPVALCGGSRGCINETNESDNQHQTTLQVSGASIPANSVTATNCRVQVNRSTCDSRVTWHIRSNTAPTLFNRTTRTIYSRNQIGRNEPFPISLGRNEIVIRNSGTPVAGVAPAVATARCAIGLTEQNGVCRDTNTLTGTGCLVTQIGGNSCNGRINWQFSSTAQNNTPTHVRRNPSTLFYRNVSSGNNQPIEILLGSNTIRLVTGSNQTSAQSTVGPSLILNASCDASRNLVRRNNTCQCADGFAVVNGQCQSSVMPAPSCVLQSDQTTIERGSSARLTWTAQNAVNSATLTPLTGSQSESINANNTGGSRMVSPTNTQTYTMTVTNAAGVSRTCATTVRVTNPLITCPAGQVRLGDSCVIPLSITLTPTPQLIRNGTATELVLETNATYPVSCTIVGPLAENQISAVIVQPGSQQTIQTAELQHATNFTANCQAVGSADINATATSQVSVTALIYEI